MDFQYLEAFFQIAQTESFAQAADRMFLSKSTLSRYLSRLEDEVGAVLVDRSHNSPTLTDAGHAFYPRALALIDGWKLLCGEISMRETGQSGSLRVGYFGTYEIDMLKSAIREMRQLYPLVNITYTRRDGNCLTALRDKQDDVSFMISGCCDDHAHFSIKRVISNKGVLLINSGHSLSDRKEILPADINAETLLILGSAQSSMARSVLFFLQQHKLRPKRIRYIPNKSDLLLAVSLGEGVAIVSQYTTTESDESLRIIPIAAQPNDFDMRMIWNKDDTNPCIMLFYRAVCGQVSRREGDELFK